MAYVVVIEVRIKDAEGFGRYVEGHAPVLQRHGGKIVGGKL